MVPGSRFGLGTLTLQVNQVSSYRDELNRWGRFAKEWSGSQRSIAYEQELIGQLLRIARPRLSAQISQSLS